MIAARWYGKKDIRIETVAEPILKKGEVKVMVKCSAICSTDLSEYAEGPILTSADTRNVAVSPVILGHEFSGVVVDFSKELTGWRVGDRVTAEANRYCGNCYYCRIGLYNLCESLTINGVGCDGAFAEYITVPAYQLHRLDDRMSFEQGCLLEPVAVGLHAVRKSRMTVGETVAVVGAGPIGLVTLLAAKAAGAARVIVLEKLENRKKLAVKLGADYVLDPDRQDVIRCIKDLTHGVGVDIAFECVGVQETLSSAIEITRKAGTVVVAGIFSGTFHGNVAFNQLVSGEKQIIGSISSRDDFHYAMALVADGRLQVEELITDRIALSDIVSDGFEALLTSKHKHIKILVIPDKTNKKK